MGGWQDIRQAGHAGKARPLKAFAWKQNNAKQAGKQSAQARHSYKQKTSEQTKAGVGKEGMLQNFRRFGHKRHGC